MQAGGHCGKFITDYLLKTGKHITALTRKGSSNKIAAGVAIKEVNYDDPATLVSALEGQDCLIITLSVFAPQDTQSKLVNAAAEAKVPWILPNEWGGDMSGDIGREALIGPPVMQNRELIDSLGVSSWISVACGFWYEFSLAGSVDRYGFDFKNKNVIIFDDGQVKMTTSTWPLVGRATAKLLSSKILPDDENDKSPCLDNFRRKNVYISSFYVNQMDMLQSVLRVTGTKEADWKITYESSKERYESALEVVKKGDRSQFAKLLYSRLFYPGATAAYQTQLSNGILGLPNEDLDEFTKVAIQMDKDGFFG
jgi:hypothetical protein